MNSARIDAARCMNAHPPVIIGSRWIHRNGIRYIVYDITGEASTNPAYPVMVSYIGDNGKRWSRRLDDWYRSMSPDNTPERHGYGCPNDGEPMSIDINCPHCCKHGWVTHVQGTDCPQCYPIFVKASQPPPKSRMMIDEHPVMTEQEKFREVFQNMTAHPDQYEFIPTLAGRIIKGNSVLISVLPKTRTLTVRGLSHSAPIEIPPTLWHELNNAIRCIEEAAQHKTRSQPSFLWR